MTLINTKNPDYKKKADDLYTAYNAISDNFVLSVGECDEIGQLIKLLYSQRESKKRSFRV